MRGSHSASSFETYTPIALEIVRLYRFAERLVRS